MTMQFFGRSKRPQTRIAAVAMLGIVVGLAACNEAVVPNYNAPTKFSTSGPGFQSSAFGVWPNRGEVGNWATWSSAMGREATYFTPSEERFVTELTGLVSISNSDFIGTTVWDNLFGDVKTADTVASILPIAQFNNAPLTTNQIEGMWGYIETGKALDYMFLAESHDSLGVPINAVGQSSPPYAPVLCNELVWQQIVAMLDSAADSLAVAGAASPTDSTPFPFPLQNGFQAVERNAITFRSLTLALLAKSQVEYAYSIARQNNTSGAAPVPPFSALATAELDSAIANLDSATVLYSPTLSPSEAVMPNDNGVFVAYSSQSGDVINPIFGFIKGYFAIQPFVTGLGADSLSDKRFTSKFIATGGLPPAPDAHVIVTSADGSTADTVLVGSQWNYRNNLTANTPLPLVRNVELQFVMARALLGTGQTSAAIAAIQNVRTVVGGVGALPVPTTYLGAATFITNEARTSLIGEGLGDDIMAIRDFGLQNTFQTLWNLPNISNTDLQTTLLPISNSDLLPRNNDLTPSCSGAPASVVTRPLAPRAKKVAPRGSVGVSRGMIIKH